MAAALTRLHPPLSVPDQEALLVEALFNAKRAIASRLRPELERDGLSAPMFWALHQLVSDGSMSVGQIASACVVTPAGVSAAVERLETAGLVVRHPGPRDRRVVVLTATARGRSRHQAVWNRLARVLVSSLRGLPTADLETTARVLGRLSATSANVASSEGLRR
jgi:DNA-binding MarR family transcriptional regulator